MGNKNPRWVTVHTWGKNGTVGFAGPCIAYHAEFEGETVRHWDEPLMRDCRYCGYPSCLLASAARDVCVPVYDGETIEDALRKRLLEEIIDRARRVGVPYTESEMMARGCWL